MSNRPAPAENKMGVMPVGRLLANMAIPMMISMLVQALYNVVDSVFVARVSENALTAVSLAGVLLLLEEPLYLTQTGFLFSFGAVLAAGIILPVMPGRDLPPT